MGSMTETSKQSKPLQVATFDSFQVNQVQSFNILFNQQVKPSDLFVSITNPQIGSLDKQLDWSSPATSGGGSDATTRHYHQVNGAKCTVSFTAPIVGAYTIKVDLINQPNQNDNSCQFLAKAYDLSKVFINGSSGRCRVNESYEFSVDASEAGEGQLEIAVNEGEIPNQVQVLDNGKCIVDFIPEEPVPHVVDIKFNGHNVNGCPFTVQVERADASAVAGTEMTTRPIQPVITIYEEPKLIKNERVLVDTLAVFELHNIKSDHLDKNDIVVVDPENRSIDYAIVKDPVKPGRFSFEFKPATVGDYSVELRPRGKLSSELPSSIQENFPFSVKVFDFKEVFVSSVTNGVIGHPIFFFIDASQAGSGNLEIRVSSKTRNVPNYPQSEANAKIRVKFTPTEAVDHTIDVKFNGISVPNNPFVVKVAQYPQARLPLTSQDILKYVAVNEPVEFRVDYLGNKMHELTRDNCSVSVLNVSNFTSVKLDDIQLVKPLDKNDQAHFKIKFEANKIGPYKLFIVVNNEILPGSPIESNVYDIHEVKVSFEKENANKKPVGKINEPVTFTVDASRAGEGTLALAVVSSQSSNPVPTSVNVSDKGHGLYNLSFIPTEFTVHSIDMSFNDRVVPNSPFIVDILNAVGESALSLSQPRQTSANGYNADNSNALNKTQEMAQDMSALSLKSGSASKSNKVNKQANFISKEDEMLQSIVVHGVSLKRTPVNSTGAFIIETNRMTQARDFDVLIADPCNSMVDVQCYRDQGGNLIAEWTPIRVGTHKIEVLYRDKPVPGSPFMSEAFDPSGVQLEPLKTNQFTLDDLIELKINRNEAGQADLEVMLSDPSGYEQTIDVQTTKGDQVNPLEVVSFRPKMPGKHRVTITFGGYEVPKSPLVLNVRDNRDPVKVSGTGLICAEVNRSAQFNVESSSDGELKLRIECVDREIVPKVERKGRSYNIKYKPTDVGYATISLYWDGSHIDGSPFSIPVNDLSKFVFLNPAQNNQPVSNQIALEYEPRSAREITLDTSKCGPGELRAEAYCRANPSIKFSIPVNHMTTGRHKLIFTCPPGPEQLATGTNLKDFPMEATYLIRFYYNNLAVPETLASVVLSPTATSRTKTTATSGSSLAGKGSQRVVQPVEQNNNSKPNSLSMERQTTGEIVALRGHGLVEAKCGEEAAFTIDGRSVGHGKPEVKFYCQGDEVRVQLELVEENLYKATYVALAEGAYTLNVLWDGKQVAGCPITVNVLPGCDSSKVICTADSLKGGVLGEEIKTFIDTRKAGPGELTALCTGPVKVAFCELLDRGDGTFVLYIKPQESGRHLLTINYGGQHIPKSPFSFKVSGKPDPTKVNVYGPGVEHGVLSLYQSRFVCDTRGAGAGQMTVRIRGPKGAFRIDTQRENRKILCKYDPTEPGDYRIEIKWSGRHVPGSPFSVMIFDTQEELNRFLLGRQQANKKPSSNGANVNGGGSGPVGPASHHHQVPSCLIEYGHYSNGVAPPAAVGGKQNSQFRLQ